ncbi:putative membrane protein [Roseiarcus fermentans]|uniref:Putative membrane protein n=1 Tax=Roseiarcus fermentans TaxID=1473586 RepID=A0A366F384_9HYPH|nr:DUF1345 domain-containing protein [Roseiarcus fermentans]RBP08616.1 putative membrane protein [Roseiarcus fermentans]
MTIPPPSPAADEEPGGFLVTLAHRPRLLAGAAIMIATYFVLLFAPLVMRESTRLLIAWNAGSWAYLLLIAQMMRRPTADPRVEARPEDENQWVLVVLGVTASCAALAAIVWDLGPVKTMDGFGKAEHVALVVTSLLSAWTYIQVLFAIHYAGVFFAAVAGGRPGGLDFPGKPDPEWTEFVYQAFTVGCTFASSDTSVTSTRMRRICVIQGVVAFFFNTIIVALAINIAAGFF